MECNLYDRQDYGGFWRRYFANSLDAILLGILFSVVSVSAIPEGISTILVLLTFLTYMIGFKVYWGATPGYRMLKMKIVAINGAEVSVKQMFIRLISSLFSALAFGLGFIWIAFDKNKQAWHDKIAGTYIVRKNAKSVRTVKIPQGSLIRTRLFALMVLVTFTLFSALFGGVMYIIKSTDAYQLSEQYIRDNQWMQQEVGNSINFGLFPSGNVSTSGASGAADFSIHISGDKGEVSVAVMMEKIENQWIIIEAGYIGKNGNYIDITQPYVKKKNLSIIPHNMAYEKLSADQIQAVMQAVSEIEIPTIDPDEVAVIETEFGRMVIEFDVENAPVHSANFKKLANAGYYDGVTFHRVISGFMLQGGDINSRDDDPTNDGMGGPGYTISAEIHNVHKRGTVAAARPGNNVNPERRSSGSQFYICHVDVPHLDGEYTAYGQVIEGLDVVDRIAEVSTGPGNRPFEDVVMQRVYMTTKYKLDN